MAGASIIDIFLDATTAVLVIFCTSFAGYLAIHKKIVTDAFPGQLSALMFRILLPCFLFVKVGEAVTVQRIALWWPLLFFSVFHIAVAYGVGEFLYRFIGRNRVAAPLRPLLVNTICFANSGNLPYTLITAVASSSVFSGFHGEASDLSVADRGTAYISLYVVLWNVASWTWGFSRMQRPALIKPSETLAQFVARMQSSTTVSEHPQDHGEDDGSEMHDLSLSMDEESIQHVGLIGSNQEQQEHDDEREHEEEDSHNSPGAEEKSINLSSPSSSSAMNVSPPASPVTNTSTTSTESTKKVPSKWSTMKKNILSPPIVATFVAIAVAMIPPVKKYVLMDPPPIWYALIASCRMLGAIFLGCAMIVLGASLAITHRKQRESKRNGTRASALNGWALNLSVVGRLIIAPLISTPITLALWQLPFMFPPEARDPALLFVLLLEPAAPGAMNLNVQTMLNGNFASDEVTMVLFWQYLFSLVTMTLWSAVFMAILPTFTA